MLSAGLAEHASSTALAAARVTARQACFLPGSDDGAPVIGRVPGAPNAVVACGLTCWGILNAPATGLAVARLVARDDAAAVVDLAPFSPGRFR